MAKYAVEKGIAIAARKFFKELGSPVNKSTVRSIKSSFLRRCLFSKEELTELPKDDSDVPFYWENMMRI